MSEPTTPKEMLEHLTEHLNDEYDVYIMSKQVQYIIREFNRLAGLDRSLHDARNNALDAAWFLREMGEVEL